MGEGSIVGCFDCFGTFPEVALNVLNETWPFLHHCSAYLVSIVFGFSFEGRTMVLIVTVPISLQIFNYT